MLDEIELTIERTPLLSTNNRFGDPAYRSWYNQSLLTLDECFDFEARHYFQNSFGNCSRIDYGTGHELSFIAFMTCLFCTGKLSEASDAFHIFRKYIQVVQKLQSYFRLEPAGSHGVWGLDDYQFIPFLWGAAQLIGSDSSPSSMISDSLPFDSLFSDAVRYVCSKKFGSFHEHSPMLYDICNGVQKWEKVHAGLKKMYVVEVLGKVPIVQHFLFGPILSFK